MRRQYLFIISVIISLGLIFSICQYYESFKTEDVSAVTVGVPNPGHAWSLLECSSDTLCIDIPNKRLGIGTNNPTALLHVVQNGTSSYFLKLGDSGASTNRFVVDGNGNVSITGQLYMTCPTDWIDSGYGFCVMQYEARNVGGVATSTASGTPWVSITQTAAATACSALGNGAHLITNAEWTTLARDAESLASNWSGGTVGSGAMAHGWAAGTANGDSWTNTAVASTTGSSCLYNTGANTCGSSGTFLYRRTLNLSNGNTIWDLSGNAYEWTHDICYSGTGTGYWYNSSWLEWNDSNLTDYEKLISGPMSGTYTGDNGVGRYLGCTANGDTFFRGGAFNDGSYAGAFALRLDFSPSGTAASIGFRCVR